MSAIVSENPTLNRQKIRPPYLVTLIKNKRSPALPSREAEVLLCNHTDSLVNFGLSSQSEFIVPALQEFCNIIDIPTEIKIGIIGASFIKTVGIISHHITGVSLPISVVVHILAVVLETFDYLVANLICHHSQRSFAVCHNENPP